MGIFLAALTVLSLFATPQMTWANGASSPDSSSQIEQEIPAYTTIIPQPESSPASDAVITAALVNVAISPRACRAETLSDGGNYVGCRVTFNDGTVKVFKSSEVTALGCGSFCDPRSLSDFITFEIPGSAFFIGIQTDGGLESGSAD